MPAQDVGLALQIGLMVIVDPEKLRDWEVGPTGQIFESISQNPKRAVLCS